MIIGKPTTNSIYCCVCNTISESTWNQLVPNIKTSIRFDIYYKIQIPTRIRLTLNG
jgi:hypothetical protein